MEKPKIRVTILTIAAVLTATIILAIACAPAAPTPRSNGDETAQPHQSTENESVGQQEAPPAEWTPPPPPTSPAVKPVVNTNLQRKLARHAEEKANRRAAGETAPTVYVEIVVTVAEPENVDELVEFMNEHATGWVDWNKYDGTNRNVNGAIARIDLDLVPTVEAMPGVIEIYEVIPAQPSSQLQQSVPTLEPAEVLGADTWQAVGIDGAGTEVGIIDRDFRNLDAQIKDPIIQGSRFFCYDSNGTPTQTNFAACETPRLNAQGTPVPNPHGTEVVKAFLEIAPNATLYISNANTAGTVRFATSWLTAKRSDANDSDRPYDLTTNNNYNVKVINWSASVPWDGPGDGTSASATTMEISPLDTLNQAVSNGAIWTNAAGNRAERTWFSRSPLNFNHRHYLEFSSTGTDNEKQCNSVTIKPQTAYTFQLRWAGLWPRADINLNLHLLGPISTNNQGQFTSQNDPQSGQQTHYPREVLLFNSGSAKGTYCLYVSKDPSDADPAWIQLQIFGPNIPLQTATGTGSIDNPAESNNTGMLAVGATDSMATPTIKDFSARGPAPEPYPPERIKPDVVSINTTIPGTSFAAPRVTGLAALAIQALGDRTDYDEPHEIVSYLKRAAKIGPTDPVNEWGHGLAYLPQPEAPTDLDLKHLSCNRLNWLQLDFTHSDWDAREQANRNFFYRVQLKNTNTLSTRNTVHPRNSDIYRATSLEEENTYQATAKACWRDISGSSGCTAESTPSVEVTIPKEICVPNHINAIPGDGRITIRWDDEPDAPSYKVEHQDGTISTTSNPYLVVTGLENGTRYRYRVLATGATDENGNNAWTHSVSAIPRPATPTTPTGTGGTAPHYKSKDENVTLHWDDAPDNALYRVRQWDGTATNSDGTTGQWRRLPFTEKGRGNIYTIGFEYLYSQAQAIIKGLRSGTTYYYMIKAINGEEESEWSEPFTVMTNVVFDHT